MFLALAHMIGATKTSCFLHLHTWSVLRKHHVSCTCTHGWCYATSCFLHLHTWSVLRNIMGWGGDDNVLCTCTHGWCYATPCSWHLHTWTVLRNIMFLALAHMVGATQHHGVGWGWGGVGWGGDDNVHCTCTHGRCYGNVTHVLQEKKADCHVVGAPDSL